MFYALAHGRIPTHGFEFEHVLRDIETLNQWALAGQLHVTAISVHGYAYVADRYAILPHGASMGDGYGPLLVATQPCKAAELQAKRIAVPGLRTSAYLALRLFLPEFDAEVLPFDQIMDAVEAGQVDAGLLIHEGQLTHAQHGLHPVADLGAWWKERTGLPLPLGVNVIRKDLGATTIARVSDILYESIRYGLAHRRQALDYALEYGRGVHRTLADRFVGMYVNHWTQDMGDAGRESIWRFLREGHAAGVLPFLPDAEFVPKPGG
ncbi:MAG: ABC transporter substrate-binding protein [Armatimonadetes bacterium]|nr:ABC transporter substrate-binding protein [Armatimonadota bacterium]